MRRAARSGFGCVVDHGEFGRKRAGERHEHHLRVRTHARVRVGRNVGSDVRKRRKVERERSTKVRSRSVQFCINKNR